MYNRLTDKRVQSVKHAHSEILPCKTVRIGVRVSLISLILDSVAAESASVSAPIFPDSSLYRQISFNNSSLVN